MDEFLTDQQRAEQVRGWFRENGLFLVLGVVLGLGGLYGWHKYRAWSADRSEQASAVFEELLAAARADRPARVEELAKQLEKDYGRTPYPDQARLVLARLAMDKSSPEEAARLLRQVAEGGGSEELRTVARLRWARVLLQTEKYDEALKVLDTPKDTMFAARFHEVRGDVRVAQNRIAEARTEYDEALKSTEPGVIDRPLVQAKRDDLGGAQPAPVPAS